MDLLAELEAIPKDDDFRSALDALTDGWRARGVGIEGVEAALAFIAAHPDLDYGAPGALVHFAEEFYRKGYEAVLLRAFAARPTPLTAWMVNRLLNGAASATEHAAYVDAFEQAAANPATDAATRADVLHFLGRS